MEIIKFVVTSDPLIILQLITVRKIAGSKNVKNKNCKYSKFNGDEDASMNNASTFGVVGLDMLVGL